MGEHAEHMIPCTGEVHSDLPGASASPTSDGELQIDDGLADMDELVAGLGNMGAANFSNLVGNMGSNSQVGASDNMGAPLTAAQMGTVSGPRAGVPQTNE